MKKGTAFGRTLFWCCFVNFGLAAQEELRFFPAFAAHGRELFHHRLDKSAGHDPRALGAFFGTCLAFDAAAHVLDCRAFCRNSAGGADFCTMQAENAVAADFMRDPDWAPLARYG